MKSHWRKKSGWTLLEVAAVIMLIGIVGAVVLVRYQGGGADLISQCAALKTHLRFAQLRAMNTSMGWGIGFNNGSYWLFSTEDADRPVLLPGADRGVVDLTARYGISIQLIQSTSTESFLVAFDGLGRPGVRLNEKTVAASSEDLVIRLSEGAGDRSESIVITAQTGFIP